MARKFLTPIDMNKLEIRNLLLHLIAGSASSPVEGQVWYDTTAKRIAFRTNTTTLSAIASGADLAAGSVANTALTTNPLARANHTGTQLAATVSDFDTQVRLSRLDQLAAPTASVSMNSQKITGVLAPTTGTDAANKQYVDDSIAGLSWKDEVKVATTATGTLATAYANGQTVDGVTLVTGDRILLKDQATNAENGIYTVNASGSPTRASDSDSGAKITGAAVFVSQGTANSGSRWVSSVTGVITIGSTGITFANFGGGASYTAGNGLVLSANDFNVGAGTGITVQADTVSIDSAVVVRKYAATIGNGSSTVIAVNHALGTRDCIVQCYDTTTYESVDTDVVRTDTANVTLTFAVAPTTNQYRVLVQA